VYAAQLLTVSEIHMPYKLHINIISPTSNDFLDLQMLKRGCKINMKIKIIFFFFSAKVLVLISQSPSYTASA